MKALKVVLVCFFLLVAGFLGIGFVASSSPEGQARSHERSAIELCWDGQKRKSLSPEEARFIAGACEKMEADYRAKWNRDP